LIDKVENGECAMDIQKEIDQLRFDIEVRIRYHDLRRAFFGTLYRFHAIGIFLFCFFLLWAIYESPVLGSTVVLLLIAFHAVNFVFGKYEGHWLAGFDGACQFHERLYQSFTELDVEIVVAGNCTESQYREFQVKNKMLQLEDIDLFRVVYTAAQNMTRCARGLSERPLSPKERWFGDFFRMREINTVDFSHCS